MTLTGDEGSLGAFCYLRDQSSDSHLSESSHAGMVQFQLRDTVGGPLTAYYLQTQKGWVMRPPELESVEVQRRDKEVRHGSYLGRPLALEVFTGCGWRE